MAIYIGVILAVILLYFIFKDKKMYFCISAGTLLFFLVAFRHTSMGILDTENVYLPIFMRVQQHSFIEILTNSMLSGNDIAWLNGKLFFLITKCITCFTTDYQIYLGLIGAPYIISTMYIVYKYSKQPLVSVIIFMALYYLYSFFLIRQMLSISFILLAFVFMKKKKPFLFTIMVLIATLIHQTAIIFLIAYPICKYVKFGKKNFIIIAITFGVAYFFPQIIYFLIERLDFTGKIIQRIQHGIYDSNNSVSMFGAFLTIAMLCFSTYYRQKELEKPMDDSLFHLSTLGSLVFCMSSVVSEFYRLSLFFSIFNILLVSNYVVLEKNKMIQNVLISLIVICASLYMLTRSINNTNSNPYIFYWSDVE